MNSIQKCLLSLCLLAVLTSCTNGIGETVESAYRLPLLPEPAYKFSRNGESSVNTAECEFLKSPIDRIFSAYLSNASMSTQYAYDVALQLFQQGKYGLKPREEIARSAAHVADRTQILKDIEGWIEVSARIAGRGQTDPSEYRNREARPGESGYVGINIGDKDICFVDEKGLAVAEIYHYAMMGTVYLDKLLNVHLDRSVLEADAVRTEHDLTHLLSGHNYTALEHHWDLAYGYYNFWKPLAQADGLPALRDSHRRIFRCLVEGRTRMKTSDYAEIALQRDTIRQEMGRVVAARAMHLLVGVNTIANLRENPKQAFRLLSQAYGLIYAAQFTCDAQGTPMLTYAEVRQLLQKLEHGNGLWEKERLLGGETEEGSLRQLAAWLGNRFGISLQEIDK